MKRKEAEALVAGVQRALDYLGTIESDRQITIDLMIVLVGTLHAIAQCCQDNDHGDLVAKVNEQLNLIVALVAANAADGPIELDELLRGMDDDGRGG